MNDPGNDAGTTRAAGPKLHLAALYCVCFALLSALLASRRQMMKEYHFTESFVSTPTALPGKVDDEISAYDVSDLLESELAYTVGWFPDFRGSLSAYVAETRTWSEVRRDDYDAGTDRVRMIMAMPQDAGMAMASLQLKFWHQWMFLTGNREQQNYVAAMLRLLRSVAPPPIPLKTPRLDFVYPEAFLQDFLNRPVQAIHVEKMTIESLLRVIGKSTGVEFTLRSFFAPAPAFDRIRGTLLKFDLEAGPLSVILNRALAIASLAGGPESPVKLAWHVTDKAIIVDDNPGDSLQDDLVIRVYDVRDLEAAESALVTRNGKFNFYPGDENRTLQTIRDRLRDQLYYLLPGSTRPPIFAGKLFLLDTRANHATLELRLGELRRSLASQAATREVNPSSPVPTQPSTTRSVR